MSVARVLELSAVSPESHEAAIREAVDRATRTLRGVQSAAIWRYHLQRRHFRKTPQFL